MGGTQSRSRGVSLGSRFRKRLVGVGCPCRVSCVHAGWHAPTPRRARTHSLPRGAVRGHGERALERVSLSRSPPRASASAPRPRAVERDGAASAKREPVCRDRGSSSSRGRGLPTDWSAESATHDSACARGKPHATRSEHRRQATHTHKAPATTLCDIAAFVAQLRAQNRRHRAAEPVPGASGHRSHRHPLRHRSHRLVVRAAATGSAEDVRTTAPPRRQRSPPLRAQRGEARGHMAAAAAAAQTTQRGVQSQQRSRCAARTCFARLSSDAPRLEQRGADSVCFGPAFRHKRAEASAGGDRPRDPRSRTLATRTGRSSSRAGCVSPKPEARRAFCSGRAAAGRPARRGAARRKPPRLGAARRGAAARRAEG